MSEGIINVWICVNGDHTHQVGGLDGKPVNAIALTQTIHAAMVGFGYTNITSSVITELNGERKSYTCERVGPEEANKLALAVEPEKSE